MTTAVSLSDTPAPRAAGFGTGLVRPVVAYLAVIAIDGWLVFARDAYPLYDDLIAAAARGASDVVRFAIPFLPILAVAALPAFVAALELGARFGQGSRLRWTVIAAGTWLAWAVILVQAVLSAGTFFVYPEFQAPLYAVMAGSGGVVGALAFGGRDVAVRPGRVLLALGGLIAATMLIGAFVTLGWWGGPA